jgi:diguanylate cyclase (GGDEF)-like protein
MNPGSRLLLALATSLVAVGAVSYVLISSQLRQDQIDNYTAIQHADARSFELLARRNPHRIAIREIGELLGAIGRRPGTDEAILVGPDRVIRASAENSRIGTEDDDPNTVETLRSGSSFTGRESDPGENGDNFEFIVPVRFPDGRYALEVSFDSASLSALLADVRRVLLAVVAAAIAAVIALFYLLGGRALLRSHRLALERATRDGLTDLPNQRAFQDEFDQAAALAARHEDPLALAILDLDHFKLVNDRHGHPEGDALLKRIAAILREGRSADRAYRIGGDEFALLLPHTDEEGAGTLIHRLSRTLGEAEAAVSIGVAAMRPGETGDELRAEAEAALYEAKRRGGRGAVLFAEIRDRAAVTTSAKRQAVQRLVDEGNLMTVFQPIWDFGSNSLLGVEALSRPDPTYGLSGPAEAFDVAEQIGCVHELDELCATRALRAGSDTPSDALLFINLAPKTLELDAEADGWLLDAVERAGLSPERVVIEMTERIRARLEPVTRSLRRLRDSGFAIALDDVGTGNAGLEMLRKIGADYVKLDHGIVGAAATEPNARAVLMAMATFACQTGAFVIAEGVEDEETLAFLRGVEAVDFRPGTIIQGGQGFELGGPSPRMPTGRALQPR